MMSRLLGQFIHSIMMNRLLGPFLYSIMNSRLLGQFLLNIMMSRLLCQFLHSIIMSRLQGQFLHSIMMSRLLGQFLHSVMMSRMDGWVRVLHPFNSISVISRRWKGEHERLCAMKRCLASRKISPSAGFEPATPWSEVGSANRLATRTLLYEQAAGPVSTQHYDKQAAGPVSTQHYDEQAAGTDIYLLHHVDQDSVRW